MTLLACGTCGISMLSSILPPFVYWAYLLPVAFVAYHVILSKEGTLSAGRLTINITLAAIAFILSAVMLSFVIVPLMFLTVFLTFLVKLVSKDKTARMIALAVLGLYTVTGLVTFRQAKTQGPYWQLTRFKAGSPGMGYYSQTAKEKIFSKEELLKYLQSEQPRVRENTRKIIIQTARYETDRAEAKSFSLALGSIDPSLAREYSQSVNLEVSEEDANDPPHPATTPTSLTTPEK